MLTAFASFPSFFFQLLRYSRQHLSFLSHRAALMTKTDLTFPAFSLRFVDFAVQFCFCCKFSISFHNKRPLGMTVAWFSWTNHNSMLHIATNEIASFCVDDRLCQMAVWCLPKWAKAGFQVESFWNKKGFSVSSLFLYDVKTTRLHVVMHLFSNRSSKMSKCGKNRKKW